MSPLSSFVASFVLFSSFITTAVAAPVRRQADFAFPELPYAQFQISSTPGGTAQQEAAAIFLDPFSGVDLASLNDSVEKNIAAMRTAAENAEVDLFNAAIDSAASKEEADALQVGKVKNKVLKHTAFLQVLKIKLAKAQAAGEDTTKIEADLATRQTKLDKNSAADRLNDGKTSRSPVASASPAAPPTTSGAVSNSTTTSAISNPTPTGSVSNTDAVSSVSASSFKELPYAQFQISSTPGGTAAEEAAAQFLDPFKGTDLATLDTSVETALSNMRDAAESAEVDKFNPAIDAASGAEAAALQVGKIKNKVLKHTIFLQIFNIRLAKAQAAGKDTASIEASLTDRKAKLATNTALDQKNKGKASKAIV